MHPNKVENFILRHKLTFNPLESFPMKPHLLDLKHLRMMNMGNRLTSTNGVNTPCHLVTELWILRLLVKAQAWKALESNMFVGRYSDLNLNVRGLSDFAQRMQELTERFQETNQIGRRNFPDDFGSIVKEMREHKFEGIENFGPIPRELEEGLAQCEALALTEPLFFSPFNENLEMIARLFGLNDDEKTVFAFLLLVKCSGNMKSIANLFTYTTGGVKLMGEVIACATDLELIKVRKALQPDSILTTSLVKFNGGETSDFEDLYTINEAIDEDVLLETRVSEKDFLDRRFSAGQTPELTLDDFDHIPSVKTTLLPYLAKALNEHRAGVNVLLYGEPGTGKTELSRVLGKALGACTYEIATKEDSDDRQGENTRLDHWQVASNLLQSNERALLLLDEAEDIFAAGISFFGINMNTPLRKNKAQINRLLETNSCPTIWMTNSLHAMDTSMIRRFDILLEVAQPSRQQRRKIIDKLAGDTLSCELRERLSRAKDLSPAVIARALKVSDSVEPVAGTARDKLMVNLVNETLRAQRKDLVQNSTSSMQKVYSLDFVNADVDLEKLIDGIARRPQARLCLYGTPGTGKSAYAAWLAEKLNKPLIVKRASDLLDCFVGMTERNIAEAFRQAKIDGAVLLIDEADSFLQDRAKSMHSWETTLVNEMLTQIEAFDGILIVTTNLVDTLDAASIRRFDIKVKFDALTQSQAQALFESYAVEFGIEDSVTESHLRQAGELSSVTPGDFAAVARQAGFHPVTDASDFVARLQAECSLKKENKHRPIGFG